MSALQMKQDGKDGKFSRVLKWVGYLTAIFSLCATIGGVGKYLYGRAETRKNLSGLLATEAEQEKSRDYSSAWQTLERAAKLDPDAAKVRAMQERLAVVWLDAVYFMGDEKYSAVAQELEPVLSRAAAAAKPGREQADLRARVGWAYYLESRDGTSDVDPTGPFREAAGEDSNNPYAEAMWGYSVLLGHCYRMKEATAHFAAAVSSQREGEFVRRLQLYALLGCSGIEQADQEVNRVANTMRKEQRTIDDWERDHILSLYYFELAHPTPKSSAFINAVPPAEHVATFHWLFDSLNSDSDGDSSNLEFRTFYLAVIEEAAGQRDEALASYRLLLSKIRPGSAFWDPSNAAVKRLTH